MGSGWWIVDSGWKVVCVAGLCRVAVEEWWVMDGVGMCEALTPSCQQCIRDNKIN